MDTVSITAMGLISSFPLWEVMCGTVATSVWGLLVVGTSSSSGIVLNRSMTFGTDDVGVVVAVCDEGVLGVQTYVLGLGDFGGGAVAISPSNFRKAF